MTVGLIIRSEKAGDYPAIHEVHAGAFGQPNEASHFREALPDDPSDNAGRVGFPAAFDNV